MKAYNFEMGPQFRFQNRSRLTPFVDTLVESAVCTRDFRTAGAGLTQESEDSRTGASLLFGGGFDFRIVSRSSIRFGIDYNPTFLGAPYRGVSGVQNNVGINLGLVIHSRYDRYN